MNKKIDCKKEFPQYYKPKSRPAIIDIPEMTFFMIDGKGDPGTSQDYISAIECLYGVSYTLKMKIIKKEAPNSDYVVPPLEGLWHIPDMSKWLEVSRDEWQWTMMIRIPDFITENQIQKSIQLTKEAKFMQALPKLRFETYKEGTCVQIMYVGSYKDEGPTIQKVHKFAIDEGYTLHGKHHEVYLSDPRKVDESKLRTVIRQPIIKK